MVFIAKVFINYLDSNNSMAYFEVALPGNMLDRSRRH